jgi:hypothetical protein
MPGSTRSIRKAIVPAICLFTLIVNAAIAQSEARDQLLPSTETEASQPREKGVDKLGLADFWKGHITAYVPWQRGYRFKRLFKSWR